ncbi:hypothetical protein A6C57_25155 [Fibrella sp. ES10-3-2-2]
MHRLIILLIVSMLAANQSKAGSRYKDFVITDTIIWGLTTSGTLRPFTKADGKPAAKEVVNQSKIIAIGKDKAGHLVIADSSKAIKYYDEKQRTWQLIANYTFTFYGLVFTTDNRCFAITDQGIEDVKTHKLYFAEKNVNNQIKQQTKWRLPACQYIDRHDNIWIGFGFGEWGGEVFIFDTATKTFVAPTSNSDQPDRLAGLSGVKSFFEDSTAVYLTASTQHMMMTGGSIVKFDKFKATTLLTSRSRWSEPKPDQVAGKLMQLQHMIAGEYIGPATYNWFNNSIYFYSQHGFFRGNKSKNLSDLKNWELLVKPELQWQSGQPDAVGSPMNVLKIEILAENTFIFLSQNDGIGYVYGNTINMLN